MTCILKKVLFFALFLVFNLQTFAAESDVKEISYYGGRSGQQYQLGLNTEVYRTEYRQVQVPYTERVCTRETRYRQECQTVPGQRICRTEYRQYCENRRICQRGPNGPICTIQQVCQNIPVQVCQDTPPQTVCRQIPYEEVVCRDVTRYRTETRAYTVLDKRVEAQVQLHLSHKAGEGNHHLVIESELNRDVLQFRGMNRNDGEQLLALATTQIDRQQNGEQVRLTANAEIEVYKARDYRAMIEQPAQMTLRFGVLTLEWPTALVPRTDEVGLGLRLNTIRGIAVDRYLAPHEIRWVQTEGKTVVEIPLRLIVGPGYDTVRGSIGELTLATVLRPSRTVLNAREFNQWQQFQGLRLILD